VVTTTGNGRGQATIAVCFENAQAASCAASTSPQKKRVIARSRFSVRLMQKSTGTSAPFVRMMACVGLPEVTPQVLRGWPIVLASW
jgi:hypothetical protein